MDLYHLSASFILLAVNTIRMAGATEGTESQSVTLEEQLTVKGLADEPMKFLMFGASDSHLEDILLPEEQNSLIRLPPFVDLTQLLKPM